MVQVAFVPDCDVGFQPNFLGLFQVMKWQTLKIEWDRIPMDPGPSKLLAIELLDTQVFFGGPWTVGSGGRFLGLDLCFFVFVYVFFEFWKKHGILIV